MSVERWRYDGMLVFNGLSADVIYEPRWWQLGRWLRLFVWVLLRRASRRRVMITLVDPTAQQVHRRYVDVPVRVVPRSVWRRPSRLRRKT